MTLITGVMILIDQCMHLVHLGPRVPQLRDGKDSQQRLRALSLKIGLGSAVRKVAGVWSRAQLARIFES